MEKKKAAVAMSGGVDSSVTAALLLEQGYEVIGLTMRLDDDLPPDGLTEAARDARLVAETLGIPHQVVDLREIFRERVIRPFLAAYARGETPNPCIECNHYLKFGVLLERALELGATHLATGHYACVAEEGGRFVLRKARYAQKDQSYVLFNLREADLSRILLPLGEFRKSEVRALAERLGLPVAQKPESQEICFVPDDDYHAYLAQHAPEALQPGEIVDTSGRVLGRHRGVPLYTIGQRRGLGIAAPEPLYVTRLDSPGRRVIVGSNAEVFAPGLLAGKWNWLVPECAGQAEVRAAAKIRYHHEAAPCRALPQADGRMRIEFSDPQRAVSPGQSVVLYDGDRVLGGGIIEAPLET